VHNASSRHAPPSEPRLLITAGPTHEPIDAVRYIGNRSTGRLGIALAEAATRRGWRVTLLLGPTPLTTTDTAVQLVRFQTTAELESLLDRHFGESDVLVMAAAVADYRPRRQPAGRKLRRTGEKMVLEMDPTPDLVAGCAARQREGQTIVAFALEPEAELMDSARSKLERKKVDAIVANPLETMESDSIRATLVRRDGSEMATGGRIAKTEFADWLLDAIVQVHSGVAEASSHA
jgi:phosphopantothenoylcysteine decarboxylase/phosphopantothenate--cysteine ligase